MVEKIGHIKNPLKIIAIFAAIAEISGTIVLPFIASDNQATYVWFLILFPFLLITLFFLTLNFNHKVLYAPSDYQNEDNFLRSLPRATLVEKFQKMEAEIAENETSSSPEPSVDPTTKDDSSSAVASREAIAYKNLVHRSTQASYMLAEELIFSKLSKEFSAEIQREVKIDSLGKHFIFDGIVREKGITTFIEVKYFRNAYVAGMQLQETLKRIEEAAKHLPNEQTEKFRVLLALATSEDFERKSQFMEKIKHYQNEFSFPIDVRLFSLAELEREFNVRA